MSRQVQWQRVQVAAGRCRVCGRRRGKSKWRCDQCQAKERVRQKAWRVKRMLEEYQHG